MHRHGAHQLGLLSKHPAQTSVAGELLDEGKVAALEEDRRGQVSIAAPRAKGREAPLHKKPE